MTPRAKLLAATGAAAVALLAVLPALGQDAPQSILPPGFGGPAPSPAPARPTAPAAAAPTSVDADSATPPPPAPNPGADEGIAVSDQALPPADIAVDEAAEQPAEMPDAAKRSLDLVGGEPVYGQDTFGDTDGRYLATLMRRLDAPVASRWVEIMLRRVLLGATPAPEGEAQADWVADRAALLLRLGEAPAARMLVQAVDVENFTPRLRQAAVRAAFATADPAALCALPDGPEQAGGHPAWPMIRAMCATLAGDAATANATIGRAPAGDPIDHALAEKLVVIGGGGRRTVVIDWTAVDTLTDWRFGIATALGALVPQALLDAAPAWFTAWLAQAPMLAAADRVPAARVAAALGPVGSADLVDLYARLFDESGAQDTDSPAGRLRAAYRGDDDDARLSALHALWDAPAGGGANDRDRYAASILTARAATAIVPSADRKDDVAPLVAAMFAAGFDRQAARWARVVDAADGADGDRAWSILAVGAEQPVVATTAARVQQYADRGGSSARQRTALLLGGLVGLGRLDAPAAATIAAKGQISLAPSAPLARALDRAVDQRASGTVALLVAVGMQNARWGAVPAGDFLRMIGALRAVGLEGEARMIAAEAMSRA